MKGTRQEWRNLSSSAEMDELKIFKRSGERNTVCIAAQEKIDSFVQITFFALFNFGVLIQYKNLSNELMVL